MIVCTQGRNQLGNTFLTWSLYYLSGETENRVIKEDMSYSYNKVPTSPINRNAKNAHQHLKTHLAGKDQFDNCIALIKKQPNLNRVYCLYPKPISILSASEHVTGNSKTSMSTMTSEEIESIERYINSDYAAIAKSCHENNVKLIHNVSNNYYKYVYRPRDTGPALNGTKVSSILEKTIKDNEWRYPGQQIEFNNGKDIWDIRESLAINMSVKPNQENKFTDYSLPHFYLEGTSLFFDGIYIIKNIMDYCDLTIDQSRWDKWKTVYYDWQESAQLKPLRLTRNIDHVCQSIVNGWDHNLTQYNLDLIDESFIQHMLIYKHGMTIKGWGIEKFPGNTRDFNELLEPAFYQGLIERDYS